MASSVPPSQSSIASRQPTMKLRAACNSCCAAKVKCSGQKTGCERCCSIGSPCVYLESRVGKVPGVRAKRKQSQSQSQLQSQIQSRSQSQPQSQSQSQLQSQSHQSQGLVAVTHPDHQPTYTQHTDHPVTPAPSSHDSNFLASDYDDILSWGNDAELADASHDVSQYMNDSTMAAMDFSMQDLLETPPSSVNTVEGPDAPTGSRSQTMPLSLGLRPRNEQDSQCILECCYIISDLENYIMSDLKAFRILLGIVRKALASLTTLVGFQQESRSLRCLFLFSTIMYQVLEMLESTVANVENTSQSQHISGPSLLSSGLRMPQLGFGDFGLDHSEQAAWRLQTISKEVRRSMEVLKKIQILSGVGPTGTETVGGDIGKSRESRHTDLILRFQQLSARISQT
ncbi:hypothetical protein GQ44DRAFT_354941 [Phaeosphaeriaceae sp. PMI808]|nr:hypothetical protein GQ44DRAFT_354941 [Phaeosphaeriaceae sp. PMI808]